MGAIVKAAARVAVVVVVARDEKELAIKQTCLDRRLLWQGEVIM